MHKGGEAGGDSCGTSSYYCDELAQEHRAEDPGPSIANGFSLRRACVGAREAAEAVPAESVRRAEPQLLLYE
ncbi:hypothetical protein B0X71_10710 [Planococcus lenghuensis]|uniref:Uncharacterized protein n=1 Tax=Planococcus lenghuensis TaxID=2213202 RepID=A0A1Q2KZC5_9BACL|nr:hypothetical protein B0X71_10710 [Planococcus lenghuensis]